MSTTTGSAASDPTEAKAAASGSEPSAADAESAETPVAVRPKRTAQITAPAVIALLGLLLALAGTVIATRPLRTPLQDCGTAASFLLDGRVSVLADPSNPPAGLTAEEVTANNQRPCQERATGRARPAAVLITVGVAVVGASALYESVIRGRWRLKRRRTRLDG